MRSLKILFMLIVFSLCIFSNTEASDLKLYRNREYAFSINIPAEFVFRTPRGPNVKMSAYLPGSGANMNIIVKPLGINLSTEENNFLVKEILPELVANIQSSPNATILDYGTIDITKHKVAYIKAKIRYNYPEGQFSLYSYIFTIITNGKTYTISYFANKNDFKYYTPIFIRSIYSFVDETGWY